MPCQAMTVNHLIDSSWMAEVGEIVSVSLPHVFFPNERAVDENVSQLGLTLLKSEGFMNNGRTLWLGTARLVIRYMLIR